MLPLAHPTGLAASALDLARLLVFQSSSEDTLGLLAGFVIGLAIVYGGFRKWQQMRLMQDTPTEKVRSAAVGRTELTGTAKPIEAEGTIARPFTDGECLVATYEIEEWENDADDDGGSWNTLDSGTLFVPFHLDDGTGRMCVEPEPDATYEISEENRTRIRVGTGRSPPGEVRSFFDRQYDESDEGLLGGLLFGGPDARGSDKRRYTQEIIPPGEEVYLLGGAQPAGEARGDTPTRLVLGKDDASDEFIVSDHTEGELVSRYRWTAPGMIVGGLALSAVTLYLLLA